MFKVIDWAGTHMHRGDFQAEYETYQDGWDAIFIHVNNQIDNGEIIEDDYGDACGEYYVVEVENDQG